MYAQLQFESNVIPLWDKGFDQSGQLQGSAPARLASAGK